MIQAVSRRLPTTDFGGQRGTAAHRTTTAARPRRGHRLALLAALLAVGLALSSIGAHSAHAAKPTVLSNGDWPTTPIANSLVTGWLFDNRDTSAYPRQKLAGAWQMWYQGLATDGTYLYQIEDIQDANRNQMGIGIHRMKPDGTASDWMKYRGSAFIDAIQGGNAATCLKIGKKRVLALSGPTVNGKGSVWLADMSGTALKNVRRLAFNFPIKGIAYVRSTKKGAVMLVADNNRNLYKTTITAKTKGRVKPSFVMKMKVPTRSDGAMDGMSIGVGENGNALVSTPALQGIAYHAGFVYTFDQHDSIAGNGNTYLYAYKMPTVKKGEKRKKRKPVTASYKKVYLPAKNGFFYREIEGLAFIGNTCYASNVDYSLSDHTRRKYIFVIRGRIDKASLARKSFSYTGKEVRPKLTVRCSGRILKEGKDYVLSYGTNVEPGIATVTATGINGCQGSKTRAFRITRAKPKIALSATSKYVTAKRAAKSATALKLRVKSPRIDTVAYKVIQRDEAITFKNGAATLKKGAYADGDTFRIVVKITVGPSSRYKRASKSFALSFKIGRAPSSKKTGGADTGAPLQAAKR